MGLIQPLRGIVTAMVTPLKADGSLDREGLDRLVEHLIGGGVHGLFILGTTGEAPALSYSVRSELIELACKRVAGRIPVLVGITDTSYEEANRMARKAYESGADAVVAAPPYYYSVNQEDLFHYFRDMASDVPLPLFLYNAPSNTHHTISVATVLRAAEVPNIVGLKDSGLKMGYFHEVQQGFRSKPEFSLLVGPEEILADAVLLGGHGSMAAGSNVAPELFVSLYKAAAAGNASLARELQHQVMQFGAAVYGSADYGANPLRGLKCALSLMGICGDAMARPLRPYTSAERAKVQQFLESSKIAVDLAGRS